MKEEKRFCGKYPILKANFIIFHTIPNVYCHFIISNFITISHHILGTCMVRWLKSRWLLYDSYILRKAGKAYKVKVVKDYALSNCKSREHSRCSCYSFKSHCYNYQIILLIFYVRVLSLQIRHLHEMLTYWRFWYK